LAKGWNGVGLGVIVRVGAGTIVGTGALVGWDVDVALAVGDSTNVGVAVGALLPQPTRTKNIALVITHPKKLRAFFIVPPV
jgi:hypothetical protein